MDDWPWPAKCGVWFVALVVWPAALGAAVTAWLWHRMSRRRYW